MSVVGHRRPPGTTTRMRLYNAEREPPLNGLVYDSPRETHRGYRIVGVEEVARPGRWNLVLERLSWPDFIREVEELVEAGEAQPVAFVLVKIDGS